MQIIRKQHIELLKKIGKTADELGFDCFVVGGYVRDKILGRPFKKDIDIVCIGSGIELAKAVGNSFSPRKFASIFKNFGTAQLVIDDLEIEFVGARKESYNRESRKPIVENGTLQDDQNRRDFTVNAMSVQINEVGFGKLLDPFGGMQDLENKIIRTPLDPNITFSDDPLRMLRAVRFATQLNFEIEANTFNAIEENKDRIGILSKERITAELNKIIESDQPSKGFILLEKAKILDKFFWEFSKLKGVDYIDGKGHKDNFYHTLEVLENVVKSNGDLWLRWAAILHDIAKPKTKKFDNKRGWTFDAHDFLGAKMVPKIFKRLKLPLDQKMKFVQKLVALHLRPIALVKAEVTDSAIRRLLFDAGDDIDALMQLCAADVTTKSEFKKKKYQRNFELVKIKLKEVEEKDKIRNFQPPVTGEMIMNTFALQPSKQVGLIKDAIKDAILDGEIKNEYEEAFAFMLKKGKEFGLMASN